MSSFDHLIDLSHERYLVGSSGRSSQHVHSRQTMDLETLRLNTIDTCMIVECHSPDRLRLKQRLEVYFNNHLSQHIPRNQIKLTKEIKMLKRRQPSQADQSQSILTRLPPVKGNQSHDFSQSFAELRDLRSAER